MQNKFQIWVRAARPFSFTASMMPVLLGAALTVYLEQSARWELLPLIMMASLAIHAGTNMVSEYFDYCKGVDRPETRGGSRVIIEKLLSPKEVLAGGLALFAVTAAIVYFLSGSEGSRYSSLARSGWSGDFSTAHPSERAWGIWRCSS